MTNQWSSFNPARRRPPYRHLSLVDMCCFFFILLAVLCADRLSVSVCVCARVSPRLTGRVVKPHRRRLYPFPKLLLISLSSVSLHRSVPSPPTPQAQQWLQHNEVIGPLHPFSLSVRLRILQRYWAVFGVWRALFRHVSPPVMQTDSPMTH